MYSGDKKQLVREAWLAYLAHDHAKAFTAIHDDVRWTVPGNAPGVSGVNIGKQRMIEVGELGKQLFPNGVQPEIKNVFAEDDTVIIEYTNHGKVFNGRDYCNDYVIVFQLRDGKIAEIREYYDTMKVQSALYAESE